MVTIEIDGIELKVNNGSMLIEAADEAGIRIPRFCYHKKLSIAANCRMCLVEVEKAAKPLPACATPVTEGMKVHTRSPKALAAQKSVMEFLLINHPLDCPICDQGGECELQDVAMGYGGDVSKYAEKKRVVREKDIGPLIATDMTRCIHCTRCVRFGDEIAGLRELGATGRGEHMEIGTYISKAVSSEMSGNVIDVCPVGALTSKPFRYSARAWEMRQYESIAPHDCIGSNIYLHTRRGRVMRVVPRENEAVNETWISDRDRYSYEGLYSADRLTVPMMNVDGEWRETEWDTALEAAVSGLKDVVDHSGAPQLGALIGPSTTLEEMYQVQKILRGLGSDNIEHRLRQRDFSDQDAAPAFPWLGTPLAALETANAILLVGSDIRREQPIAGHRVRKAHVAGAAVFAVNPVDYDFNFALEHKLVVDPRRMTSALAAIARHLVTITGATNPAGLDKLVQSPEYDTAARAIAERLRQAGRSTLLLGASAINHQNFAAIRMLSALIAELSGSTLGYLSDGANGSGAWIAGAVPHRGPGAQAVQTSGKNLAQMQGSGMAGMLLVNCEPDLDLAEPQSTMQMLKKAEFVVALSSYKSPALLNSASVLLPITPFSEMPGTFVNAEGRWQSFEPAVAPMGEARPGWKILRVMGNLFDLSGFDYMSAVEIRDELQKLVGDVAKDNSLAWRAPEAGQIDGGTLVSISDIPIYSVDALVRRAPALQKAQKLLGPGFRISAALARKIGLKDSQEVKVKQGDREARIAVEIDDRVPESCVWIHADISDASKLGAGYAPIVLEKA